MGTWERFQNVVQRSVEDLLRGQDDPLLLLGQAIEEMERELAQAQVQLRQQRKVAQEPLALAKARTEEAAHLSRRAQDAKAQGLPEEAQRLSAGASKALKHAQELEAEAAKNEAELAGLSQSVLELDRLVTETKTKRDELDRNLRGVRAQVKSSTHAPSPQVGGPIPNSGRTREHVNRDLDDLETKQAVDDKLAALKKKAGRT